MRTITAGSNHFIIPKKIVFTGFLIGLGTFLGMYLSEHLHAKRTEMFLKKKNDSVKESNEKLVQEKGAYQTIFDELKDHLADWEKGRDMSLTEQAKHVTSFHDQVGARPARAGPGQGEGVCGGVGGTRRRATTFQREPAIEVRPSRVECDSWSVALTPYGAPRWNLCCAIFRGIP